MSNFVRIGNDWWLNFDHITSVRLRVALKSDTRLYGYRQEGQRWYELTFKDKPHIYAIDPEEREDEQYKLSIDETEDGDAFDALTAWLEKRAQ